MEMSNAVEEYLKPTTIQYFFETNKNHFTHKFLGHADVLGIYMSLDINTYKLNCILNIDHVLHMHEWFNFLLPSGSFYKVHRFLRNQQGFGDNLYRYFDNITYPLDAHCWSFYAILDKKDFYKNSIKEYLNIQKTHQLIAGMPITDNELKYIWENNKYVTKHGSENL